MQKLRFSLALAVLEELRAVHNETLVHHVVPILRARDVLKLRRLSLPRGVHLRGVRDHLHMAVHIVRKGVQGPQAASDVFGLALILTAGSLEAVPWIDLDDTCPVARLRPRSCRGTLKARALLRVQD